MLEIIEFLLGKNIVEFVVIVENLRVFRILRLLKMVSKIKKNIFGRLNVLIKMFLIGDYKYMK